MPDSPARRQRAAGVPEAQNLLQDEGGDGTRQLCLEKKVTAPQPSGDPQQTQIAAQTSQDADEQGRPDQQHVEGGAQQIKSERTAMQAQRTDPAEVARHKSRYPRPARSRMRDHRGLLGRVQADRRIRQTSRNPGQGSLRVTKGRPDWDVCSPGQYSVSCRWRWSSPPNTFMENLQIRWPLAEPGELVEKRPIILDGGMGRELLRMGAPFRQPEWSALALIEAPEFVIRAHAAFAAAGAEVLTTSNYAVVPSCLGPSRFAAQGSSLADSNT